MRRSPGANSDLCAVHGRAPTVNRILDHPDIRAVAFVGSNGAGRHVLERGTAHGKRVQVPSRITPQDIRLLAVGLYSQLPASLVLCRTVGAWRP